MEMTGLQIFKYMPAAKKSPNGNCKKCGCPTCMMFSLKLAKQQTELDKCPYIDEELRQKYNQSIKHPQKTIRIGNLSVGGENVLYRHQKTFINPTALGIIIDCDNPDFENKIKEIQNYELSVVGEIFKVDLIILKNCPKDYELRENIITYDDFKKLELDFYEENNFAQTKNYLIETRKTAILDKDESCSSPVCVFIKNDDICSQCARAGYYLCKYANMIIFQEFNKNLLNTLFALRYNIFTDPQKTLQVESGLYKFNNPDKNSIVFMTTNFALTFFAVSNELQSLDVPTYLIVIPAQGMSVLTAWSAQTFTADIVAKALKDLDIKNQINTRKIIIPGLLSDLKDELNSECPDFEFVMGTREASEISDFVKKIENT